MLAPLSFLKEYVSLSSPVDKIAEKLLLSGTKVEAIKKFGTETVLELEITPNRPDTLSMIGLARELAALFERDLELPDTETLLPPSKFSSSVELAIRNKKLIPYYSAVQLFGITIEPSPKWLAEFLELSGIRPINNVVDVTNFVMLETGQPMHAFDAGKIKGEIVVRGAKKGEKVTTLDSIERTLPEGAIIIEDSEKLIDLAGLMGGENSGISEDTTEIILLCPIYDPVTIRKTSIAVNLRTEASTRFEKKLDPNNHLFALNRAMKLLTETSGARQNSRVITTPKVDERTLEVDTDRINDTLGIRLSDSEIFDLLGRLGFKVKESSYQENSLEIKIPSFRTDIAIEEDIIEDLARLYGYNKLPKTLPEGSTVTKTTTDDSTQKAIRELLLLNGYSELTGYTLVSSDDLTTFDFKPEETLKVLNPASSDFEYLRPTLLINLIKACAVNQDRPDLAFFEIAKIYKKETDPITKLPKQPLQIGFISNQNLATIKGQISEIFSKTGQTVRQESVQPSNNFEAEIKLLAGQTELGNLGKVKDELLSKFELSGEFYAGNFLVEKFAEINNLEYQPMAKFPSVYEDFSFYVDKKYQIGDIVTKVKAIDETIVDLALKDVYQDSSGRSITLGVEFNSSEKTLTKDDISKARDKIIKYLKSEFKAKMKE